MENWDERDRRAVRKQIAQLWIEVALVLAFGIATVALVLWLER